MTIYADKGTSLLALVNNLKLALAATFFSQSLEVSDNESLLFKQDNFQLHEPNAIVKYLAGDFSEHKTFSLDEVLLHAAIKSGNTDNILKVITEESSPLIDKAEVTPHQIVLFASLYPLLSKTSSRTLFSTWYDEFSQIPKVKQAVETATSITKVERTMPKNTGAQKVQTGHLVKPLGGEILPKQNERNILITSSLPYVNNVPHLGNIVGSVLSADIYARYAKNRNYNTLYVCGTDEYGTATETKALEEKVSPKELCDKYFKIHKEVYDWFDIGFDYFGRTTTPLQTEIAQEIFTKLYNNGYLEEQTNQQLYCETHKSFLADRFVEGTCPKCQYEDARGDQCDKCGSLLNPFELIDPRCKVDNSTPVERSSTHIYIKLNELEPELKAWIDEASEKGAWSKNSKYITYSWLREGLEPRCITRDLVWGTPVPLEKYKDKVLYVWFDAPIGYVSITANYFKEHENWKKWWLNPENVDLYQFMGKDNVPFHSVVFPASQIGTRDNWTKLHHLSTTEYLQYEDGKFSKSRGVGVFGNNAKETGVSPSVWRYYLSSVRPETSDSHFSWREFVTKNNTELLANLGNFVNRLVKFHIAKYNGVIPEYSTSSIPNYGVFNKEVNDLLKTYIDAMEAVSLRRGLETAMAISARGNQFLQDNKLDNSLFAENPDRSDAVVAVGLNLIYLVSAVICPFMPETRTQISEMLNAPPMSITDKFELVLEPGHNIGKAQYLFKRIDEEMIEKWRAMYGGQQKK